jgi:hypothetical protein
MAERFFQTDIRASGQISEFNQPLGERYAASGNFVSSGMSYTKAEADARFEASGLDTVYETSGTSAALDATLPGRFQASGNYEVSGTGYTKAESDVRYVLSGTPDIEPVTRFAEQFSATSTFQVDHNLMVFPQVQTLTAGLVQLELQVTHLSTSGLRLDFLGNITSGWVICTI